jgi:hypothetical protein
LLEGGLQTVGEEGDEDVGLDALVGLVIDRPHREVVLEFLEGLLDLGQLQVIAPQRGRVLGGEIRGRSVVTPRE